MLPSMSSVLQKQHKNFCTTKEIMKNLEDLLRGQFALARQSVSTNLMNSQQKPDTSVKGHMFKLIGFFAEAKYNGAELDVNIQELQCYELMLNGCKPVQEKLEAYLVVGLSSFKGKKKAKGKKKPTKSSVPSHVDRKKAKKSKDPKKIKYVFFNRKRHFISNYKEYLN
ncbi:hypothetical protein PVK06_036295 [Gossypium arboreum]|uniref:Gag/pol protein n=1 Tax=Gossypium arboreum TaxID=29729 RepID=A0ABR0NJ59_GOSAR|nr:hypothetical protein PVK06_036295 [Gossypium arboreum]